MQTSLRSGVPGKPFHAEMDTSTFTRLHYAQLLASTACTVLISLKRER